MQLVGLLTAVGIFVSKMFCFWKQILVLVNKTDVTKTLSIQCFLIHRKQNPIVLPLELFTAQENREGITQGAPT